MITGGPIPWDVVCDSVMPEAEGEEQEFELPLGITATVRRPHVRQHYELVFSFPGRSSEVMYFHTKELAAAAVFASGAVAWNIEQSGSHKEE